jgi:hypothetical protein
MLDPYAKSETSIEEITSLMAGGAELEELGHELQRATGPHLQALAKKPATKVQKPA